MSDVIVIPPSPAPEVIVIPPGDPPTVVVTYGGPPGPPGPVGGSGYDYTQASPASIWTVAHNLGHRPLVDIFSVGGVVMVGDIVHLSVNTLQIIFSSAVSGSARLV